MQLKPILICALALGLAVAACQKKVENQVDQEALDEIALTVAESMNAPAAAIVTLMKTAGEQSQVGGDALVIGFDGQNLPVDWWLYRHGYVQMYGLLSVGRPALGLTQKARDEIAKSEARWFDAEVGEPERVDCATADAVAVAGCEVELPVTPTLTDAGRLALGEARIAPFRVVALVAPKDDGGWTVSDLRTEGAQPSDMALAAILGPEDSRQAARAAAIAEMNDRAASTPEALRQAPAEAYAGPPPPIETVAPTEQAVGGRPLGLDVPDRRR